MTGESQAATTSSGAPRSVAVLLPLPLKGAYDYGVPDGMEVARGDIVVVPLGGRPVLGVVWGPGTGDVAPAKLKSIAERIVAPPLTPSTCDFIDWMAAYVMAPPGLVLALALRSPQAFEDEKPRIAYRATGMDAPRQTAARKRVLDIAGDGLARSPGELAELAGVGLSVVKGLIQSGALEAVALPPPRFPVPDPERAGVTLSSVQLDGAAQLRATLADGFSVTFLDGVTGSGKTETYFEAVAEALRREKQVLILLPEIALTVQFLERFERRFGVRPAEWHSDLTSKQRARVWRGVAANEARVVVGARSALFLPFRRLGLVVVDEEHDAAFKQEEGVIYHARDMAIVRARFDDAPVLLSSATPSLETWVNARAGRYRRIALPDRHGDAAMPDVELIDLTRTPPDAGRFLSTPLAESVAKTLAAGDQALLFLNRRGYAPLNICRACGFRIGCPNCSSWLVEHRYRGRLVCHHCGYDTPKPRICPSCKAEDKLAASGPGVERIAEEAQALFPDACLAIASSDVLHGPNATQEAVQRMEAGEINLLIGTQIVAKGHHFPNLTLVGVVDADLGLSGGDPRARERTYQLLHQVSGRAGRAEKRGRVLLQTHAPDDPVMRALASGSRDRFLEMEAADRETHGYPPFGRLAALILSGPDEGEVIAVGRKLVGLAPEAGEAEVWGPAPALLPRLRGRSRQRILVKTPRGFRLQAYLAKWLEQAKLPSRIRLAIDIDPQSFL